MSDDRKKPGPEEERPLPWWAEGAAEDTSLPEGFPERPDLEKVQDLRQRMRQERKERKAIGRNRLTSRFDEKMGKQVRDLGSYTLIPTMMLAGPAVGYGLGWLLEKQFGGEPYMGVFGILLGLVAAFHQIILLLKKKSTRS